MKSNFYTTIDTTDGCMNGYMDGWFVLNAVYDTVHPHPLREIGMSYSNIRKTSEIIQSGKPNYEYNLLK